MAHEGGLLSDSATAEDWMAKDGVVALARDSRFPPHDFLELTTLSIRHWATSPSAIELIIGLIGGLCIVHGSMGVHSPSSVERTAGTRVVVDSTTAEYLNTLIVIIINLSWARP